MLGSLLLLAKYGTFRRGLLVASKVPWKTHDGQSTACFGNLWSLASSMFMWVQLKTFHRGLLITLQVLWSAHDEVFAICL